MLITQMELGRKYHKSMILGIRLDLSTSQVTNLIMGLNKTNQQSQESNCSKIQMALVEIRMESSMSQATLPNSRVQYQSTPLHSKITLNTQITKVHKINITTICPKKR